MCAYITCFNLAAHTQVEAARQEERKELSRRRRRLFDSSDSGLLGEGASAKLEAHCQQ